LKIEEIYDMLYLSKISLQANILGQPLVNNIKRLTDKNVDNEQLKKMKGK